MVRSAVPSLLGKGMRDEVIVDLRNNVEMEDKMFDND